VTATTDYAAPVRDLLQRGSLVLDGGMGTALLARGLSQRAPCWNLSRPEEVLAVHRRHVAAGAQLVLTNTFVGATPQEAAAALLLARKSAARFVGASLWAGLPDLPRQLAQLEGADCVWLETATSAEMALHAVRIASASSALPIVITCAMSKAPLDDLRAAGAAAAGYNCSPWPADAAGADVLKLDADALDAASWARRVPRARLQGGCCGVSESYLAALRATAR
jgi:methionine synthase I (cobalamin-dependent)